MRDMTFTAGLLPHRAVIHVDGPDAGHFLHTLVTADIDRLATGEARHAALLSPQGKILFDFCVVRQADGYAIDCSRAQSEALVKRLGLYKLRANVALRLGDEAVGVSPEARGWADPRHADMGWRFFAAPGSLPESPDYVSHRLAQGLADSDADIGSGEHFPHEANLDQLNGVSFTKGCYVGQEVVSRMEHRGTARNRMLPVRFDGPAPVKGSEVRSGDKVVGTVLSTRATRGLALLRVDRLAEASEPLLTGDVRVHVLKPRWARYDVPGAEDIA